MYGRVNAGGKLEQGNGQQPTTPFKGKHPMPQDPPRGPHLSKVPPLPNTTTLGPQMLPHGPLVGIFAI